MISIDQKEVAEDFTSNQFARSCWLVPPRPVAHEMTHRRMPGIEIGWAQQAEIDLPGLQCLDLLWPSVELTQGKSGAPACAPEVG